MGRDYESNPLVRFATDKGAVWIKPAQVGAVDDEVEHDDGVRTCLVTLANGRQWRVPLPADDVVRALWPDSPAPAGSGNGSGRRKPAESGETHAAKVARYAEGLDG